MKSDVRCCSLAHIILLSTLVLCLAIAASFAEATAKTTTAKPQQHPYSHFLDSLLLPSHQKRQDTTLPADLMDPGHPGARCVHKDELEMGFPCQDFLSYNNVYVDHYQPLRDTYARLMYSMPDAACRLGAARYFCPMYYRECLEVEAPKDATPLNQSLSNIAIIGRYGCKSICEAHVPLCSALYPASVRELYTNCDVPNTDFFGDSPYEILPESIGVYEITAPNGVAFNFTEQCYNGSLDVTYAVPVSCPEGTYAQSGECAFICPEPLIDDNEFHAITTMMSVLGWISFVLMAFLVVTYILDPSKRKFPNHLPLFFFISILFFSLAFCLASTLPDHREMICHNQHEPNYFGDGACTVQAILITYFFQAAVCWWLIISFNLFFMLVMTFQRGGIDMEVQKQRIGTILMWSFHLFAWVLPLIPLIISLSAERLGANGSDLWCTIHSSTKDNHLTLKLGASTGDINSGITVSGESSNAWNFALFWAPVILCVLIGIVLISIVIVFQLRQESGWRGCFKFVKGQWRIFAFLLLYIWVTILLFAFQLDFEAKRNEQYDEYERYTACMYRRNAQLGVDSWLKEQGMEGLDGTITTCSLNSKVSFPWWMIAAFNFVGQGIFVFLIFGTSKSIYTIWWKIITTHKLPVPSVTGSNSIHGGDSTNHTSTGGTPSKKGAITKVQGKQLSPDQVCLRNASGEEISL